MISLTANEARVIGSLLEKQVTTPDQYPLSLNSLVSACNQKSNRDPAMSLAEDEVQRVLDGLSRKHLVIERSGFGSRVSKWHQVFCNTEYGTLKFSPVELAIVTELLLRGPQTPGELRTRASRMAKIADGTEIDQALEALSTREPAIVVRLPREPNRRDARYAQLFTELPAADAPVAGTAPDAPMRRPSIDRIERLEEKIAHLELGLQELNDAVVRQAADIERLAGRNQRLAEQLESLHQEKSEPKPEDEKPPHY